MDIQEFLNVVNDTHSLPEVSMQIVWFAHQAVPDADIVLSIKNIRTANLEPEAACSPLGQVNLKPAPVEFSARPQEIQFLRLGRPVGILQLYFEAEQNADPERISQIQALAPVIALALENALLHAQADEQAAAAEAQRQRIAQDLHDSLAQNIGYMRLKLEQLARETEDQNCNCPIGLARELQHMHHAAEESYRQVRTILDELNQQSGDLFALLREQAVNISKRAGFELRTSQIGASFTLPPQTIRQIVFIVREALHNVEKHAQATQVQLQLLWLGAELIVKINDNGVGFDHLNQPNSGHYGLWIMHNRATELGGTLQFSSGSAGYENPGTEVTLWLPRPLPVADSMAYV